MSNTIILMAIFGGVFLSMACAGMALAGGLGREKRKRVEKVRTRAILHAAKPDSDIARSLLRELDGTGGIDRLLGSLLPRRAALKLRLQRAGVAMSVGRYGSLTLGAVVLAIFVLKMIFGFSLFFALLAGIALGIMVPHLMVSRLIARRLGRFNQLFPEAIDLMVRGLKSGLPISETINNVGQEMADPIGIEFRTISDAVRFGTMLDDALWEAAARIGLPEFKFFAISLSVQRETGGNLGETLSNLSDILRKRLTMRLKVKAMSSEARASAYIIGSLPFIMFLILYLMNPEYVMRLFTDPRGMIMLGIGLFMMLLGSGVMYKMVKFDI